MSPFIQLTLMNDEPCFINITKIIFVEPRGRGMDTMYEYSDRYSKREPRETVCTYIALSGGLDTESAHTMSRKVKDSYESVMDTIMCYYKNREYVAKSLSPAE